MTTSKLTAWRTILTSPRKVPTPHADGGKLNQDFESLLNDQDVPVQVREKLRSVDPSVKQAFLESSSSSPARPASPRKHARARSRNFLSPNKKAKVAIDPEMQFDVPTDFVGYLAARVPTEVRTDIVHRLRIMLRTQRIDWLTRFLELDGPLLLYRQLEQIIAIEWREEHEDCLLSELLGCVQSICTTSATTDILNVDILQSLANLLFSDKQPSDFQVRGQVMSLLEAYLVTRPELRYTRASQVLKILSDPIKPLAERPLEMLERAHRARPYKRWMSEFERPVRDCFWIFLHSDNKIPLLAPDACDRMNRRAPIVPEGYVGGVEWVAIEYMCTHLSLINSLLASLPLDERLALRTHLKTSHFETICGAQLRRASTKFYMYLHEELAIWASRAFSDGWPVGSVIEPPRPEAQLHHHHPRAKSQDSGDRVVTTCSTARRPSFLPDLQF